MKGLLKIVVSALVQVPFALSAQATWMQAVDSTPVLRIGDVLGASDVFAFSEISDITVVGDSILVLEGLTSEIRIFNHRGEFLGNIGRRGEGPGEFLWPTRLQHLPEGIAVVDLKLRRQSLFSPKGELLRTQPLGHLSDLPLAGSASMRGGLIIAETPVFASSEGGTQQERLVVSILPKNAQVDTLARFATGYVPFAAPGSFGFLGPRVGSGGDWAVSGDSLLVLVSGEPLVLRWFRAGALQLALEGQVELPIGPERFTRDDLQLLLEATNRERHSEGEAPLPRSVQVDPPTHWGQVKQVVVSDDNQCWVQWDEPRTDKDIHWFRIDLKTKELFRAELPPGFQMLAAARDNLYGFVLTSFDAPEMKVFHLESRD